MVEVVVNFVSFLFWVGLIYGLYVGTRKLWGWIRPPKFGLMHNEYIEVPEVPATPKKKARKKRPLTRL